MTTSGTSRPQRVDLGVHPPTGFRHPGVGGEPPCGPQLVRTGPAERAAARVRLPGAPPKKKTNSPWPPGCLADGADAARAAAIKGKKREEEKSSRRSRQPTSLLVPGRCLGAEQVG